MDAPITFKNRRTSQSRIITMILKMNRKSKGRKGVVEYLLNEREAEGTATTLRGNSELTKSLIKHIYRKHKYLSGGLMFSKEEHLSDTQKEEIMDSFEKVIFTGLATNQYNVLWVEHSDKGRIELNFVVPRIELNTGYDLDLYSHRRDLPIFDMWKNGINAKYQLADPNDPSRARTISERTKSARSTGAIVANRKSLDETLHQLVSGGHIQSRQHMLELLQQSGYKITRQNSESISVKHDDIGKTALRLKGGIYSENFTSIRDFESISRTREQRIREYDNRPTQAETRESRRIYQRYLQTRTERHKKRYQKPRRSDEKEPQIATERDQNELDTEVYANDERIEVDDRIRKLIETSHLQRTEGIKRIREREDQLLKQLKVSNLKLSNSTRESEQKISVYIAESRSSLEADITRRAEYLDGETTKANANARGIHELLARLNEQYSKFTKSITGVISEIKTLKIFNKAKKETWSDGPSIKLTPRR